MFTRKSWALVGIVTTFLPLCVRSAAAQTSVESNSVRLGPLVVAPTVSLATADDTNVFNEAVNPKQDVITVLTPRIASSMRIGSVLATATTVVPCTSFARFENQGGFGIDQAARASLLLGGLTPYIDAGYQNLRQRQNLEIDARIRQMQSSVTAGIAVRLMPHLTLDVAAKRRAVGYANDAVFAGVNLNEELSERVESLNATLSRSITPASDILMSFEARHDRFDVAGLRDADSQRVMVGLQSRALLNGHASIGYRKFTPLDREVPEFKGVVASAAIEYPFLSATHVMLDVDRDVTYSYQQLQPYYIATTVGVSVGQTLPFELVAHGRAAWLRSDYRTLSTTLTLPQADSGAVYSVGVDRRLDRHVSVGGSFESYSRHTEGAAFGHEGRRVGISVAYGF